MGFYRNHVARISAIEKRKLELVNRLMACDNGARHYGTRELWRGVKNASPELRGRYCRICQIVARYRVGHYMEGGSYAIV